MYIFSILMYILFYCSCFTNIDGLWLTMMVYLMIIHLIFCLSFMFC